VNYQGKLTFVIGSDESLEAGLAVDDVSWSGRCRSCGNQAFEASILL